MNTPKLPPLPEPKALGMDFDNGWDGVRAYGYTAEQMQAYAIAAIEAQGVEDRVVLQIDAAVTQAQKLISDWNEWYGMHGENAPIPPCGIVKAQEMLSVAKSLLASAPPAPQADNWRQYATEREDTAQAVIERHRKEHESLLRLLAKDRQTIADLKASVVQQEPVAWKHDCAALLTNDVELWIDACPHCGKPRTNPTQQAKPQPLLSSEIWNNDAIMEVNADAQLPYELIERFVRAIEAAHNIGEKK